MVWLFIRKMVPIVCHVYLKIKVYCIQFLRQYIYVLCIEEYNVKLTKRLDTAQDEIR